MSSETSELPSFKFTNFLHLQQPACRAVMHVLWLLSSTSGFPIWSNGSDPGQDCTGCIGDQCSKQCCPVSRDKDPFCPNCQGKLSCLKPNSCRCLRSRPILFSSSWARPPATNRETPTPTLLFIPGADFNCLASRPQVGLGGWPAYGGAHVFPHRLAVINSPPPRRWLQALSTILGWRTRGSARCSSFLTITGATQWDRDFWSMRTSSAESA